MVASKTSKTAIWVKKSFGENVVIGAGPYIISTSAYEWGDREREGPLVNNADYL